MKLGGRQLAIMQVLWDGGEATVAELQEMLDVERPLAYSTVATVISRMEQKGLVTHRSEGRVFYYRPVVSEDGVGESMVGELVERIFGGSPSELVSHLLESDQVNSGELDRIKQLVRQHERLHKSKNGAAK